MVPLQIDKISNLYSDEARFVLVVEKDATFQRLLDDGFVSQMPCILITVTKILISLLAHWLYQVIPAR